MFYSPQGSESPGKQVKLHDCGLSHPCPRNYYITGDTAVNNNNKNPHPHGSYSLVVLNQETRNCIGIKEAEDRDITEMVQEKGKIGRDVLPEEI